MERFKTDQKKERARWIEVNEAEVFDLIQIQSLSQVLFFLEF